MNIKIRKATPDDLSLILNFIRQLAKYEKLESEVSATEDQLKQTLFQNMFAHVLLIEENNKAVGFALYFFNYSTFLAKPGIYLEDLYIKEEHRGKGFGKMLLQYLAQVAVENNCGRLEWSVLDWNTPAIKFYESVGAKALDEWTVYRLSGDALKDFSKS